MRKSRTSDLSCLEHEMPFGPQRLSDGRVQFRLWAPAQRRPACSSPTAGPNIF